MTSAESQYFCHLTASKRRISSITFAAVGRKWTLQNWRGRDSHIGSCDSGDLEGYLVAQELVEPRDDFRAKSTGPIGFVQYDHIARSASDSRLQSIIVQGAQFIKYDPCPIIALGFTAQPALRQCIASGPWR